VGLGIGGYFSKDEILVVAYHRTYPAEADAAGPPAHGEGAGESRAALAAYNSASFAEAGPAEHASGHEGGAKASTEARMPRLPRWMLWCAIAIAYVTPFYMLRVWWLTFMGEPRNHDVYEHAHESRLMYIPLVVLSVGTLFSSYLLFRPMIADAAQTATDAATVVAFDGHALHAAHEDLVWRVGFAFLVGFAVAWLIYRHGLALAHRIAGLPVVRYVYAALVEKLFFDHLYNTVIVKGTTRVVAPICRWFDGGFDRRGQLFGVIDRILNLSAAAVARLAFFTRDWFDIRGIDGALDGLAGLTQEVGGTLRRPQTGRIRNYLLLAAGVATVAVLGVVFQQQIRSFVWG
jgi:NADH-quinone oxidoreductase subunit L